MKYLITESSLDKIVGKLLSSKQKLMPDEEVSKIIRMYLQLNPDVNIENLIFEKLDGKRFILIEKLNKIYFVNSEDDEYAQIRYNKSGGWCYIYWKLIGEISSFFSLEESYSEQVIGRWVENTLQMRVTQTKEKIGITPSTLQMRVTNTSSSLLRSSGFR